MTNAELDQQILDIEEPSGRVVLQAVYDFIGRFVSYPTEHAQTAHALWCVHAHLMHLWDTTPRLAFLSPEPASGKSRALEVTELLVPSPVMAVNVSPAYLFRKVGSEGGPPTILFDEIDTVFGPKAKENEEVRGLLNAGHRRGAVAGRCVSLGKTVVTEEIPAYAAVVLAGLGWLPDTIMTRSIAIQMRRRHSGERIEPFRRRIHAVRGHEIRQRIETWARVQPGIEEWPELPAGVEDRDADVWESIIAVADMAGGDWPERARSAAVALVAVGKEAEPSLGVRLLGDLRIVFGNAEQVTTVAIINALREMPEAPWNDLKGRPIDDRGLALKLRKYGIKSRSIAVGDARPRGYRREDFVDAWKRYFPPVAAKSATSATAATLEENQLDRVADEVADRGYVADKVAPVAAEVADNYPKNIIKTNGVAAVAAVADLSGHEGPVCAQCAGKHDGTERPFTIDDRAIWLHPECQPFYPEGDGWGRR
jgi:hypothetical protein